MGHRRYYNSYNSSLEWGCPERLYLRLLAELYRLLKVHPIQTSPSAPWPGVVVIPLLLHLLRLGKVLPG